MPGEPAGCPELSDFDWFVQRELGCSAYLRYVYALGAAQAHLLGPSDPAAQRLSGRRQADRCAARTGCAWRPLPGVQDSQQDKGTPSGIEHSTQVAYNKPYNNTGIP